MRVVSLKLERLAVLFGKQLFWAADRNKYSGMAMLLRKVHYGLPDNFEDARSRDIAVELKDFFLVIGYIPNS